MKWLDRLLEATPAYRKSCELERRLAAVTEDLKNAIAAARPVDRTDELLMELRTAIRASRPADRTNEILVAVAAARPRDRTEEIKAAIAAARPEDRTDEIKAAIRSARPKDHSDELRKVIRESRPVDRTDEVLAAVAAAKPLDRTDEIIAAVAAAKPVDRTDEIIAAVTAAKPVDRADDIYNAFDYRLGLRKDELAGFIVDGQRRTEEIIEKSLQRANIIGGDRFNWIMHGIGAFRAPMNENCDIENVKTALRTKWELVDRLYVEPEEAQCPVCGRKFATAAAEKRESDGIWGGGHLVRYVCPQCGLTFGPLKMFGLTPQEFADDYRVHYSVYTEGDCTEQEKRVFSKFKPEKGRKYLDWGCGAWSRTIEDLRKDGYDVYGYEPFAKTDSPYIFHTLEEMKDFRFDGIFSHDLLEHVRDPIAFFRENVSVLADDGVMIHSTACYEYVYAYTRFHLYFYTGDSLAEICRRAGVVQLAKEVDDVCLQIDVTFRKAGKE